MKRFKAGLLAWGLATFAYGLAQRQEWLPREPALLAAAVGVLLAGCVVMAALLLVQLRRRAARPARALAAVAALAGLVAVGAGGLANWALSLHGALLLNEGDTVPLATTSHFTGYSAGPLVDASELAVALRLTRVELVSAGPDGYAPETHLNLQPGHAAAVDLEVAPQRSAAWGGLRFHQGAFGFAPRIVVTREGATLLDERVPFNSVLAGPGELRFERTFTLEREGVTMTGSIDISGLDERMKGHARLVLDVTKGGALLGHGELLPGHFADLQDGYRVGFAGLSKWSEVLVSRRVSSAPVVAGLAVAALGSVAWLIAVFVERRRGA